MSKIKCEIKGEIIECKVIDNLGYVQNVGTYVKEIEHNGKNFMAIKISNGLWRLWTTEDRVKLKSNYTGQ